MDADNQGQGGQPPIGGGPQGAGQPVPDPIPVPVLSTAPQIVPQKTDQWFLGIVAVVWVATSVVGVILLAIGGMAGWTAGSIFCLISLTYLFMGLTRVPQEKRYIMELFGAYIGIKGPGIIFQWPFIVRARAAVSLWEQPVNLFHEGPDGKREQIKIAFLAGGSALIIDPIVWVKVIGGNEKEQRENAVRMIYGVNKWKDAVREAVENALRNVISNLTVEQTFKQIHGRKVDSWWNIVLQHFPNLPEKLKVWGVEVTRITISDFEFDKETQAARQKVFEAQRSVAEQKLRVGTAEAQAIQKALETGRVHSLIKEELIKGGTSPDEADKLAADYVKYFKAADTKRLIDWRGGGSSLPELAAQLMTVADIAKRQMGSPEEQPDGQAGQGGGRQKRGGGQRERKGQGPAEGSQDPGEGGQGQGEGGPSPGGQ